MSNTSVTSEIKIGMNTDLHSYAMQKGQYSFAFNAAVESVDGNGFPLIQNDSSNNLAINFPSGYKVIGKKYILELDLTLYFSVNGSSSQIGYSTYCKFRDVNDTASTTLCKDCVKDINEEALPLETVIQTPYCTYTAITTSDCLNLDIHYPVDIEYRIVNNALYVYFVDDLNNLRYIYFNIVGNTLTLQDTFKIITGYDDDNCHQPIYGTDLDCNKISYNPDFTSPFVDNIQDVYGGSLKAGVYQILIAYSDVLGNPLTSYFPASYPYPLRNKDITIETNYNTEKGISFHVENLDESGIFQYYNIIIAETVDNFTTFKLIGTLPISITSYSYTGNSDVLKDLTEDEVFFNYAIFQTARSITKANDYLFFAGLKPYKRLNLQQAVNRIKAYWQTVAISESDLRKPHNVNKYRGLLRDEVYPLGIVFEFDGDNDSIVFPLIGPSAADFTQDVMATVNNDDVITNIDCSTGDSNVRNKYWQVYNTATIEASPHELLGDCEEGKVWEWGKFSYWESEDTYPNIPEVWGDLCGQPIRHFKVPDCLVTHFHDGLNATRTYEDNNIVYPIGVKVNASDVADAIAWAVTNNIITQEDADKIKAFRIVRGNRFGNKSIESKGYLYDSWNYERDTKTIYYSNFPYNDLQPNVFLAPNDDTYDGSNDSDPTPTDFVKTGRYTYHSPNTHFTNSSLGTELKLETEEYGTAEGYFNTADGQPKYKILSTAARSLAFGAGVAAALAGISKQCRVIEKPFTESVVIPEITGAVTAIATIPLPFENPIPKYTNISPNASDHFRMQGLSPTPVAPLGSKINVTDCIGTTFQWLDPASIPVLYSNNPTEAGIMTAIIILSEFISAPLYLLSQVIYETDVFTKMLQSLTPAKNYFIQYNSIGKYNSYKTVANSGNKIRPLEYATYLEPNLEYVDEPGGTIIYNNKDRESSVFLKTDSTKSLFPNPTVTDDSRISMDTAGLGHGDLNKRVYTTISSYYASVKNYVPRQYGSIYNIQYLETNSTPIPLDADSSKITFFGGDTFISRMGLKIKHPFFIQTRYNFGDNSDVEYSKLGNVAFPNYYIDYGEGLLERFQSISIGDIFTSFGTFYENLVGVDRTRLDAKQEKFFYQSGYVHLYNYGIPYFLVESDVNVDYRYGQNNLEKDYYPHQKDLDFWLQEKNVPITYDNYYFYNNSYSKQNKESELQTIKPNTLFGDKSLINDSNLLIYTERAKTLNEGDNWKILLPDNFYRTDTVYGAIISVDGIESDKVLIRSENGSQLFAAYDTLRTENGETQIANQSIFSSRPKEFAVTHLGYMGSQHKDILDTEFGHVFVDAKRGNVFNLGNGGQGLEELTQSGMRNWFRNNLPFYIKKDFPSISIDALDNSYNGLGLSLGFDRRFNRFFLTKLDYAVKDPTKVCYDGTYFRDKSNYQAIIDQYVADGYTLQGEDNCKLTFVKTEVVLPTFADIYAFFDATSMMLSDAVAASAALNAWFTQLKVDHPSYQGNLYIIPSDIEPPPRDQAEQYLRFLSQIKDGNPFLYSLDGWDAIQVLPTGFGEPGWTPTPNIILLAFVDEIEPSYHTNPENDFTGQPTTAFQDDYLQFKEALTHFDSFVGILYPIPRETPLSTRNAILQILAAVEGTTLTEGQIDALNTVVDVSSILTTNPYQGFVMPDSSVYVPLKQLGWRATYNKFSPAIDVFNSDTFAEDLNGLLDLNEPPQVVDTQVYEFPIADLHNTQLFYNKSWTISYNFYTKSWVSFHSFTPNYYIDYIDYFQSGINGVNSSLWSHGLTNKSYQVYYGTLSPFIVDIPTEYNLQNNNLNSIEYVNDTLRYHNDFDVFNSSSVTFNKAIVYNCTQNSGLLELIPKNQSDLSVKDKKINKNVRTVEISNSEGMWRFNDFYDIVKSQYNNIPVWLYDSNNVNKNLNLEALNFNKLSTNQPLIRGRVCNVRLINDKYSNYKFIFFLSEFNQTESIR